MREQFAVRLLHPVAPPMRAEMAAKAAPHLGVGAERLERLLARSPGILTKPTTREEAQRVAAIFTAAGAEVQIVPVTDDARETEATAPTSSPPAGIPLDDTPPPEPRSALEASTWDDAGEGVRRQLSLRGRLLLLALLPLLILAAAALYLTFDGAKRVGNELLAAWGDSLALTLAAEVSAYITETGLGIESAPGREEVARYTAQRLSLGEAGLRGLVGVALTDAEGRLLTANWGPDRPEPPQARFQEVAKATLQSADFGGSESALSQSLAARTKRFDGLLLVGAPLVSDLGTIQVALDPANTFKTARGGVRSLLVVVLAILALTTVLVVLMAAALTRRLRELVAAAERLSWGELDAPVELRGSDELRDLAEALERMRLSLRAAVSRLRRQEREKR